MDGITDSGGVWEETAFLGVPCLTVRKNTERPITVTEGRIPPLRMAERPGRILDVIARVGGRLIVDGGFRHDDLMLENS